MTGKNLEKVRRAALLNFFSTHLRKLDAHAREGDQIGLISASKR